MYLFETQNVPAFYVAPAPSFSLLASGRTTGIVIDSGYERTDCVPIYEGICIRSAVRSLNIGGLQIGDHLQSLLNERGHSLESDYERCIVRDIKERECSFSANDVESLTQSRFSKYYTTPMLEQRATAMDQVFGIHIARVVQQYLPQSMDAFWKGLYGDERANYELPDGQIIEIHSERFRAPELLFQPILNGTEQHGIHQLIVDSINDCDSQIQDSLYRNVVLCGGNTMFNGIDDKLKREMTDLCGDSIDIKVIAPPERKYSSWIGAGIWAETHTADSLWCTTGEYNEVGPGLVHRKCTGV